MDSKNAEEKPQKVRNSDRSWRHGPFDAQCKTYKEDAQNTKNVELIFFLVVIEGHLAMYPTVSWLLSSLTFKARCYTMAEN